MDPMVPLYTHLSHKQDVGIRGIFVFRNGLTNVKQDRSKYQAYRLNDTKLMADIPNNHRLDGAETP